MSCEHRQATTASISHTIWTSCFVIACLLGLGATKRIQSPRAISATPVIATVTTIPSPVTSRATASSTSPATNRPLNVTLAWDASLDSRVAGYSISYGVKSGVYTNSIKFGNVLTGTVSNLVQRTKYYFAAKSYATNGMESPFSAEIMYPQPFTNYIAVGIKTNNKVIVQLLYTNPPGDVVLFEPFIAVTNNNVSVLKLPTGNLQISNTNN